MSETPRYRTARYDPVPVWRRWWPLAAQEFSSLFRTKWGVAAFCICLVPGLARMVVLLILFGVVNFGPRGLRSRLSNRSGLSTLDPERVEFYLEPVLSVTPGMLFTLALTSLVVARSVARDRLSNALELYWTRGISPSAYLFAKWFGCWSLLSVVTVGVPLVLMVTATFLAEDWRPYWRSAPQFAMALLGLWVTTGIWTAVCVGISASCRAPNAAIVSWAMLVVGSTAVGFVASKALGDPGLASILSVWNAGGVVVRGIAGLPPVGGSLVGAIAALLALTVGIGAMAWRRMRLEEAVG